MIQPDPQSTDGCPQPSPGDLRLPGERGQRISFTWNGEIVEAYEGETIAAALLASGQRALRTTGQRARPRGLLCNMGVCFDCLVQVDGKLNQRACRQTVADGMTVQSQQGPGDWETQS